MNNIWLVEVKVNHQNPDHPWTWHISTLEETIKLGRDCVFRGIENNTWYILEVAYSYEEASEKCKKAMSFMETQKYAKSPFDNKYFLDTNHATPPLQEAQV